MPRFFLDYTPDETVIVGGSDANHIGRSLRMRIGDKLTFCRLGTDYFCTITEMSQSSVVCRVYSSEPSKCEPNISLTLYQAFPKQDKFETIIQKTVELGVSRIVPFISKRCVARPSTELFGKKLERFSRISEEAAKQSGRGIIPEISPLMSFDEAIADFSANDIKLICYENGGKRLNELELAGKRNIGIMIGSEGGFERGEVDTAESVGGEVIWLGERILRCETCPIAMTAIVMNLTGNM